MPLFITRDEEFNTEASINALSSRGAKGTPSSRESVAIVKRPQPVAPKPKNVEERSGLIKKRSVKLVDSPKEPSAPTKMESKPNEGVEDTELRKDFV
ncbi:hypothetical protein ECG_05680 [Echinococcus granulosus]|uniref:Expressed conserved protein n=1 Tax=Echinococcus granulosus TaxID=6210 RepID=A0A068WES7_ECHGR|nr:hypothetical protein ECG_05680 [Echinococcus granulosus]CDS18599.1 expressed conserved protein [Echinococcus granulosus]